MRAHPFTQGRIGAQFFIVTAEPFPRPPAVVFPFLNDVDFFVFILPHVSTEEPPLPLLGVRVPPVKGAAPHVSHSVGVDLGASRGVADERVVRRDAVQGPAVVAVHIDPQHFAQQG